MMKFLKSTKYADYYTLGISLSLGLSIFLFFVFIYPHHIYFQEQNQLFLFSESYFLERVCFPGGLCNYLSSFLIQFYIHSWIGAIIITLLLVVLQQLVLYLFRKLTISQTYNIVSVIPSLLYWMLLCDAHYMLTILIAQLFVLTAVAIYLNISNTNIRLIYSTLALIALYVLSGGIYWTFVPFIVFFEICYFKESVKGKKIVTVLVNILLVTALPLISKYVLQQPFPLEQLWKGIGYYRYPTIFPFIIFIVWTVVICLPIALYYLSRSYPKSSKTKNGLLCMGVLLFGLSLIYYSCNEEKETGFKYDYYMRYSLWNRILKLSEQSPPTTPIQMAIVNMSLAQTGAMGNRMFHYPQNNKDVLLPPFSDNFSIAFDIADIYYYLGIPNLAQRLTFEGMESIPDGQKSGRVIKKLTETNLINGNTDVANKYIKLLQHTVFYRMWAKNILSSVHAENKLQERHEWMDLQKVKPTTDFIFEGGNLAMLQSIVNDNPDNRIACEYLTAYSLLTKDMGSFVKTYAQTQRWYGNKIPIHYQEALLVAWYLNNSNTEGSIPFPIDPNIKDLFEKFIYAYSLTPNKSSLKDYSKTYWFYYFL